MYVIQFRTHCRWYVICACDRCITGLFKACISMYYLGRTLLKELIRERTRRDLDKNSFEQGQEPDVYYWKYGISEGSMRRIFEK